LDAFSHPGINRIFFTGHEPGLSTFETVPISL